jgi:hypothetical protein
MILYSSAEAARKLGITAAALSKYIKAKKVPIPQSVITGKTKTYIWTEQDISRVRQLLPKIANGRKARHQKKQPQPRAAVPHKQRRSKQSKP